MQASPTCHSKIPLKINLHARSPASNPASHLVHVRALDRVVAGLRGRLVEDVGRRAAQLHPLAAEPEVADARDVLVAVAKVVREEEGQAARLAEARALDGYLLHVAGPAEVKSLRRLQVLGGRKVNVVAILKDLERLRRAGRVGCP